MEDINHDGLQLCINLFEGPGKSLTVLAHLQSGGSNTTCIGCFAGAEQNAVLLEVLGSFHGGRHVSALCYSEYAVSNQLFCILQIQFVLGCTGKSYITLHGPYTMLTILLLMILCAGSCSSILGQSCTLYFLYFLQQCYIDSFGIINPAGGIGTGNYLGT